MTDIFSKNKRSAVMSKIKSRGSKIEAKVKNIFRKNHISYRSHLSSFVGKPDFTLSKTNTVVFVDSCFWHGCRYHGTYPKTNKIFWQKKIEKNIKRDKKINLLYKKMNWKVVRIWEHDLKNQDCTSKIINQLSKLNIK